MTDRADERVVIPVAAQVYLDALRAGAANLVIVAHTFLLFFHDAYEFRGGGLAVVVFFLLSGFLITWSALGKSDSRAFEFSGFMADRMARILTPYLPALVLVVLVNALWIDVRLGSPGVNAGPWAALGNALMVQDHPLFQALEMVRGQVTWRIRPYNTAEPFWTVAIEFWLYAVFGAFFFAAIKKEPVRRWALWALLLPGLPVFLWNLGGGAGKCLSLVWCLGSVAALLSRRVVFLMPAARLKSLGLGLLAVATVAIGAKVKKYGFDAYDFQMAALVGLLLYGGLLCCCAAKAVPAGLARSIQFLAAYSYSLYLTHNTVLVIFREHLKGLAPWLVIGLAVVAAHLVAYGLYLLFERHHKQVAKHLRPRLAALFGP